MTVITKPILDKKDEKIIEEPLTDNVAISIPQDPPVPDRDERNEAGRGAPTRNHSGGIRCCLVLFMVVTAVAIGFCFYKAVNRTHRPRWMTEDHDYVTQGQQRAVRGSCTLPIKVRAIFDYLDGGDDNVEKSTKEELTETRITEVEQTVEETVVQDRDGNIKVEVEVDEQMETFVIEQMPQLSRGIYLHDFKMNKTVIVDTVNDRCFIMDLDRNEIKPPKDFMELVNNMYSGMYELDVDEIRHDTRVVTPSLESVGCKEYGFVIYINCRDRTSYRLEDVEKSLKKRSTEEGKKYQFIEFGGKSFIEYNIVNLHDL